MAWLTQLRKQVGARADQAPGEAHKSFTARLRAAAEHASDEEHPWMPTLRKLKGHVVGNVERLGTWEIFDALEIPMRRRAGLTLQLSRMMRELGWSAFRAHGLNPGSYLDRVRGYARPVPGALEALDATSGRWPQRNLRKKTGDQSPATPAVGGP
jgi:hypothetical protein